MPLSALKADCARVHANITVCLSGSQTSRGCFAQCASTNRHSTMCVCVSVSVCKHVCVFQTFLDFQLQSTERWNESTLFARTHALQPCLKARM